MSPPLLGTKASLNLRLFCIYIPFGPESDMPSSRPNDRPLRAMTIQADLSHSPENGLSIRWPRIRVKQANWSLGPFFIDLSWPTSEQRKDFKAVKNSFCPLISLISPNMFLSNSKRWQKHVNDCKLYTHSYLTVPRPSDHPTSLQRKNTGYVDSLGSTNSKFLG